jgi:hypothetical protein
MMEAKHFPAEQWSLDEAIDQFMEEKFQDGDLISHDWLRMVLDINDAAIAANAFVVVERMEAFKTVLLDGHQIALQNVRGRGYRVIPPHEQARYAAEEAAKYMSKGLKKADALLTNTRHESLTKDEKRRHTDTQIRIAALSGMISKGKRDVFKLFESKKK